MKDQIKVGNSNEFHQSNNNHNNHEVTSTRMKAPLHSTLFYLALTLSALPATIDAIATNRNSSPSPSSSATLSSSSSSNALALLNTARMMREQRIRNGDGDGDSESLKARIQRKQLHDMNDQMPIDGDYFTLSRRQDEEEEDDDVLSKIKTHSVPSLLQRTYLNKQQNQRRGVKNEQHHLWAEALFDEDGMGPEHYLFSNILSSTTPQSSKEQKIQQEQEEKQKEEQFISSRVEAHLPTLTSLRTSLGSEIPDMELHLQMQAARARAAAAASSQGSGNSNNNNSQLGMTAALAFMDLHHQRNTMMVGAADGTATLSMVEKAAMSSIPSQLPGPASAVLSSTDSGSGVKSTASSVKEQKKPTSSTSKRTRISVKKLQLQGANNGDDNNVSEGSGRRRIVKAGSKIKKKRPSSSATTAAAKAATPTKRSPVKIETKKIRSKDISAIMTTKKAFLDVNKQKELKKQQRVGHEEEKGEEDIISTSSTARVTHEEEINLAQIIQKGSELHCLKSEFEETHGRDITRQEWTDLAKLDSPRELRRLVSSYRMAKNKLVMANMGLVHAVVRTRLGGSGSTVRGISYEELVQEGSLGLMRAAELFDPSRGLRFSTYATIWIKGVLGNSSVSETITLPLREKNKWNKIQTATQDLEIEHNAAVTDGESTTKYKPTDEEIAKRSGLKLEDVTKVKSKMKRAKNVLSLDYQYDSQTVSGGENSKMEAFASDKNLMDDVDLVEKLQLRADVVATLARNLDPREARLMRLRYGLKDGKTRTIVECAEAMGISRARAQQLAAGCLKKLREADDAQSLQEYLLSVA